MELDIERLHRVIEGLDNSRGCGKSTALAVKIIQTMYMDYVNGYNTRNYLLLVQNRVMKDYIRDLILEVSKSANLCEENVHFHLERLLADTVWAPGTNIHLHIVQEGDIEKISYQKDRYDDLFVDHSAVVSQYEKQYLEYIIK